MIAITLGACFIVFTVSSFTFFTVVYLKELAREERILKQNEKLLTTPIVLDPLAVEEIMNAYAPKAGKKATLSKVSTFDYDGGTPKKASKKNMN